MYTEMDNLKHAQKVKDYMAANPKATRMSIHKDCIIATTRLNYLAKHGYITLPEPTPHAYRNGLKK